METELAIRGERGCRIAILIDGYERPDAEDPDDANWLRCSVSVEVGRFRGEVEAAFMTGDFVCFASELDQVLAAGVGEAKFEPLERALVVQIELRHTGRALVQGTLRECDGPTLSFAFDSDQTFLRQLQARLAQVDARFPRRSSPCAPE